MTHVIAGHAGSTRPSPLGTPGQGIVQAIKRGLARRRTMRELHRLDDRMLADIGLNRGDIPAAAGRAVEEMAPVKSVRAGFVERLLFARAQAHMIRDLRRLPDHILLDIGIQRWRIEEAVDGLLAQGGQHRQGSVPGTVPGTAPGTAPRRTRAAVPASPVHDLLRRLDAAVRPLRQWQISRVAAGQLARLDRETMADLGYVKGDVDWVPEVMAERRLKAAANRNEPHVGVA